MTMTVFGAGDEKDAPVNARLYSARLDSARARLSVLNMPDAVKLKPSS